MAPKIFQTVYTSLILIFILFALIARANQEHLRDSNAPTHARREVDEKRSSSTTMSARHTEKLVKGVPYFQASLPMRVYECLCDFSILRCAKLFVLLKMEEHKSLSRTGNLTRDFLDQFIDAEDKLDSLINNKYANMSDEKLNQYLVLQFQRFFKHRDIKLQFLPGITVKIVPSRDNKLNFSLKKSKQAKKPADEMSGRASKLVEEIDETLGMSEVSETQSEESVLTKQSEVGGGGHGGHGGVNRRKNKKGSTYSSYKHTILQMAVPVMVMPAILMGTVLPFILPVLKMATLMTMMLNNSAFIAALIYAARTHANAQEEQHISYPPQGYF